METGQSNPQAQDGKTIALISYITIIGWVIAYVMHSNNKTSLGAFHLRQSAFIMLLVVGMYAIQYSLLFIPYIGWILSILMGVLGIGIFILWILGLIAAINGEEKPVPVFGEKIQQLLSGIA